MRKADTSSVGLSKSDQKVLAGLMEINTQLGPGGLDLWWTDKAAVLIQALRENPHFLRTSEGRMINRACTQHVRGSEWEEILFPTIDPAIESLVKEFRRKANKAWPDEE